MTPTSRVRLPKELVQRALICLAVGSITLGCAPEPQPAYRGAGLRVDTLPPNDVVSVYHATLGAAFRLDDPALSLLVDPVLLPRAAGLAGGDTMPLAARSALQRRRPVKGTCQVPVESTRAALVCRAERPGYVVRFSAPFALGAGDDSVQVHLVAQQYGIPRGPVPERIRFERAYHLVRSGPTWRAVREARLPKP